MSNINATIKLREVFPIQSVTDNFLVNGNGDVTFGFALILPEVYTLDVPSYDTLHTGIINVITRLGSGCSVHKQDFFFEDKYSTENKDGNFTKKSNITYFDQRPIIRHYSNIYFTISNSKFVKKKNSSKNSYIKQLDFIFKQPLKDIDNLIKDAYQKANNVQNGLNSLTGIRAKRLSTDQLICALYDYFNLSFDKPSTSVEGLQSAPIVFENNQLKIGNKYVGLLSMANEGKGIKGFVKNTTAPGMVYGNGIQYSDSISNNTSASFPIALGLPITHIVNTIIEIGDKDAMEPAHLEKQALRGFASFGYRPAKDKFEEQEFYLNSINKDSFTPCLTSINVILFDVDIQSLNHKIALTHTAFSNMNGSLALTENFDLANLFFASCPGNSRNNYRTFMSFVDASVCYLPKETCYSSDPNGMTFVDRYGCPVTLDMWNSPYLMNKNGLIFAPSGAGKSFLINHIIDQLLSMDYHIIVVDIGRSYERNVRMNKGLYLDAANKKNLSFNIFACPQDNTGRYLYKQSDEDGEGEDDLINFIYSILRYIWKKNEPIKNEEKAILKKSIVAYYDYVNQNQMFPKLEGFYEFTKTYESVIEGDYKELMNFKYLRLLLEPFVSGEYKYLLNSDSNVKISDHKYIVFELEAIQKNEELSNIVTMIIIKLVGDKVDKLPKGTKKKLIIDEAIDFLKGDIGDYIGGAYRKFRKKEAAVYIATQNVNFLKGANDEVRDSLLGNSDVKILLDHRNYSSSYPDLQKWLSLTNHDIDLLKSVESTSKKREFLIKMGNKSRIFGLEVSPEAAAVYTTKGSEVEVIERIYNQYKNLPLAINEFVNLKYKQDEATI